MCVCRVLRCVVLAGARMPPPFVPPRCNVCTPSDTFSHTANTPCAHAARAQVWRVCHVLRGREWCDADAAPGPAAGAGGTRRIQRWAAGARSGEARVCVGVCVGVCERRAANAGAWVATCTACTHSPRPDAHTPDTNPSHRSVAHARRSFLQTPASESSTCSQPAARQQQQQTAAAPLLLLPTAAPQRQAQQQQRNGAAMVWGLWWRAAAASHV
jgi:hypothetical protein